MYKTYEAIYKDGRVVPLEDIEAEEQSKLLVIVLDRPKSDSKTATGTHWKALKGKYKHTISSVDEFIARKC